MTAPALTVFVTGSGAVTGDNLNTFVSSCDTYAQLRAFVGTSGVQVFTRGSAAPNDGGQGFWYWDSSAIGPDNNITIIIPPAAASGGWVRIVFPTGGYYYAVDTGILNAMAVTLPVELSALPVGTIIYVNPAFNNTSATPTLSINGATGVVITTSLGAPLVANDFVAGVPAAVMVGPSQTLWLLNPGGGFGPYATALLGQLPGTATNDNASAGNIGEYMSASSGSSVSLINSTATDLCQITLTPGDWDVWGNVAFFNGASTTLLEYISGITLTSGTLPAFPNGAIQAVSGISIVGTASVYLFAGVTRISVAAPTIVYCECAASFTGGGCGGNGFIAARRVR
jgi:hypothetical protein